ncbi:MAG: SLBB domain-containing protein [Deltaproteobacteria bacterium]|nr:SLBB domain-containing protein [Deltaproteobacteria bacterium]
MPELVLMQNRRADRPATLEEYQASGGYQALEKALTTLQPRELTQLVMDSGLRGRGGAGFPAGRKWSFLRENAPHPRYVIPNTDEMEPGTFKDRILVSADPHQIIEGTLLAGYANQAERSVIFIRPSYELEAELFEREFARAREAGFLGRNILGRGFDFEITVHRSAGRYICGEASAQVTAIQGQRPRPDKLSHMTDNGLWGQPTIVNNVETLACLPHIVRHGAAWFQGLAAHPGGAGTKLYGVSGMVEKPDCYELPIGTPLREIIFEHAGGMKGGRNFKACLTGGASTKFLHPKDLDVAMDFEPLHQIGHRLGTAAVVVFDENACLVSACLNLLTFFARESCGWCTPCREGLPYMRQLLLEIELGEADESCITELRELTAKMDLSYCAFAPGAAAPVQGLLEGFEDEIREHLSQRCCPYKGE